MTEEEQEKLYKLLFKDTKNKLEATIEKLRIENAELRDELDKKNSEIEKQQTEIEEWQKAYIRENNYWLKFRNKINKIANNNKDCSDNEVIKAVKELKEKNASLQKEIKLMKSININDNYISKEKIREKIKELEEKSEFFYCDEIDVLKELLEEE